MSTIASHFTSLLLLVLAGAACSSRPSGDECQAFATKLSGAIRKELSRLAHDTAPPSEDRDHVRRGMQQFLATLTPEGCRQQLTEIPLRQRTTIASLANGTSRAQFQEGIRCVLNASSHDATMSCALNMTKASRRTEAAAVLDHIGELAKLAYAEGRQLPLGRSAETPQPSGPCSQGGKADWSHPIWQALGVKIEDPLQYRYVFESDGRGFKATAIGDADCDGNQATFVLSGHVDGANVETRLELPPLGVQ